MLKAIILCLASLIYLLAAAEGSAPANNPDIHRWPTWRGPIGGGVAPDPGFELIQLDKAKLVWQSEDTIPLGIQGGMEWGSFASPVIDEGRLFISYVRPPGQEQFPLPPQGRPSRYDKKNWRAESVMHCMDIKTGKTLWRYVSPMGQTTGGNKGGGHYTATTDSGYVCAFDSVGRVYALEAATGTLVWEKWLDFYCKRKREQRSYKELYDDSVKSNYNHFGNGFNNVPGSVNGVVAIPYSNSNIVGCDIATGEELWQVKVQGGWLNKRGTVTIPVIWTHRGKKYFVVSNTAIEPKTGKVIWSIGGQRTASAPCVVENYYISSGNDHVGSTCFQIGLNGAKKIWSLEKGRKPTMGCNDVVVGSYFLQECGGKPFNNAVLVDLNTGKTLDTIGAFRKVGYAPVSCRNFIYSGMYEPNCFEVKGQSIKHVFKGERKDWANSCSPALANGYLYHRTVNRIVCWDLAKKPRH